MPFGTGIGKSACGLSQPTPAASRTSRSRHADCFSRLPLAYAFTGPWQKTEKLQNVIAS